MITKGIDFLNLVSWLLALRGRKRVPSTAPKKRRELSTSLVSHELSASDVRALCTARLGLFSCSSSSPRSPSVVPKAGR